MGYASGQIALVLLASSGCSLVLSTDRYTDTCANLPVPAGYDRSQLVFEDAFCDANIDSSKWLTYVPGFTNFGSLQPPLSGPNAGSWDAAYWAPSQVAVQDGLTITSTPDMSQSGYAAKSGVVCTCGTKQFSGAAGKRTYVQVRAKVPAKNGMWAQVTLGSITVANWVGIMATGNTQVLQGTPVENIETAVDGSDSIFYAGVDLSTVYADYGVEIVWGESVTWMWSAIEGPRQQTHQAIAGGIADVPAASDQDVLFIQLNVINGQSGSDTWHTVWNGSDSDAFSVRAVQVYER